MAKEFKDYDKKYEYLKGTAIAYIELLGGRILRSDIDTITRWELPVRRYSNDAIRQAVYFAEDASWWQQFRVRLKGLNTKEKLYCLAWYLAHEDDSELANIRVSNYLGALKRGGQLNDKYEVVR